MQLIIEAQRGNGYKGDIAIDDISITDSYCPSKKHAPSQWTFDQWPSSFLLRLKKKSSMQKTCHCTIVYNIYLYLHNLSSYKTKKTTFNTFISQNLPRIILKLALYLWSVDLCIKYIHRRNIECSKNRSLLIMVINYNIFLNFFFIE